ncbi:MAG: LTA synthase family protein, partial [Alistipes sp.]|nr:LTA synthase family protein [Alistipes sp.]
EPRVEERMVSQIDLMPTLLDVAGINYRSPFYGQSVLDEGYVERAFVATYQDLGYVEAGRMTILSPVRRVRQYLLSPTPDEPHRLEPAPEIDSAHLRRAVAYYQTSAQ